MRRHKKKRTEAQLQAIAEEKKLLAGCAVPQGSIRLPQSRLRRTLLDMNSDDALSAISMISIAGILSAEKARLRSERERLNKELLEVSGEE